MKLQTLALGLTLAVAGSAFAATHETDVTRVTPNGTVTKHIVRHPAYHHVHRVVIVHPAHHGHYAVNRTVVVHHNG